MKVVASIIRCESTYECNMFVRVKYIFEIDCLQHKTQRSVLGTFFFVHGIRDNVPKSQYRFGIRDNVPNNYRFGIRDIVPNTETLYILVGIISKQIENI